MNLGIRVEQENDIYRQLVDTVNDYAIFALDINGYIQTWNIGAKRIKGYSAEEILGSRFHWLIDISMNYGQGGRLFVNVLTDTKHQEDCVFQQFERAGFVSEVSPLGLGSTFTVKLPLQ